MVYGLNFFLSVVEPATSKRKGLDLNLLQSIFYKCPKQGHLLRSQKAKANRTTGSIRTVHLLSWRVLQLKVVG